MNILVTGGAGFIGSHLVDALVRSNHRVTVLDNLSTGRRSNLNPCCRLVSGDLRDAGCVQKCVEDQEVVFHLAAYTSVPGSMELPEFCLETNVTGTRNLLESACYWGVRRLVFSSTSAIYPEYPDSPKAESVPPEPTSPYAESKLQGEALLRQFHQSQGLSYAALRYFNVYGPRQEADSDYASVIPAFISRCQQGKPLIIYGDGQQTRDFVYVADVVRANLTALESERCGVFNVGTANAVSIIHLAEAIIHQMDSPVQYTFQPPRPGDVLSSTADISLIVSELGWTPEWSLEAGLRETVRWARAQAEIDR